MLLDRFEKQFPAIVKALKNARKAKRLAHAYLLHGDSPQQRKDFSLLLAQIAICPQPQMDGSPCGKCKTCSQITSESYPELYTLSPSSKSRIIPVGDNEREPDTVRWFEGLFYLTSVTEAGKKVGIIYDADRMKTEAQNAFLKTLEEPPPNTFLILVTGNPSELLPTIRSRCQSILLLENRCVYDFNGAPELFNTLFELQFESANLIKAENCAQKVIAVSDALFADSEEKIEAEWKKKAKSPENEDMSAAEKKQLEERKKAAIEAEYRKNRAYFLSAVHSWFAQVYMLSCGIPLNEIPNPEIFENRNIDIKKLNEKEAFKSLSAAEEFLQNLNWNVNEELAMRCFCLNAAKSIPAD